MANCPDGHPNPAHYEFCGECGALIDTAAEELEAGKWYRTKWAIVGAGVLAVLVIAGAAVTLAVTGTATGPVRRHPTPRCRAIQEWWTDAHEHFTELQNALDDSQRALDRLDGPGLEAACQQMHDAAGVGSAGPLANPGPGPDQRTGGSHSRRPCRCAHVSVCRSRFGEQLPRRICGRRRSGRQALDEGPRAHQQGPDPPSVAARFMRAVRTEGAHESARALSGGRSAPRTRCGERRDGRTARQSARAHRPVSHR